MLKSKEQILKSFKKANKDRREKIVNAAGFNTEDEYVKHLEAAIAREKSQTVVATSPEVVKTGRTVVHTVNILDGSGSMSGSKFDNAQKAYNADLQQLKADTQNEYRSSLIVFSSRGGDKVHYDKPVAEVEALKTDASGGTPLYANIVKMMERLNSFVKPDERVLISIFTDGGDTDGRHAPKEEAIALVRAAKAKNWTVTFIGTKSDVSSMVQVFGLDDSNTLVHDNTGAGVEKAMKTTSAARTAYFSSVASGASAESLSIGFYKKQIQ